MNHISKYSALALLVSAGLIYADTQYATPYFNARSQSANLPLEMVGQQGYIHRGYSEDNYSVWSLSAAYQQSFRKSDIACCLFGEGLVESCDCAQITVSGSRVSGERGERDWLADYFGLPTDFSSTIQFSPRIRNILVDGNFFMSFDGYKEGLYLKLHIPYVHTRWELDYCERICENGENNHPFGYFSGNNPATGTPNFCTEGDGIGNLRSELLCSVSDFMSECKVPNLSNKLRFGPIVGTQATQEVDTLIEDLSTIEYNDCIVFEPLTHARWAGCNDSPLTKNGVAEFRFTLGYDTYRNDNYHLGFGLTAAAPTGNRPHGEYLFEPIIGNGNHWELGGQLTSHWRMWASEDEEKHFTAYLDANLTHLFTARQTRSFDLKGKPNSRYMLAQKLGDPCYLNNATLQKQVEVVSEDPTNEVLIDTITSGITPATAQFKNVFTPVANLTTVDVDVNIGAQIDLALMFNYTTRNYSFDLGYNLWVRTCERIKLNCKCPTRLEDGATWALKGDAYVYGTNGGCANVNICANACNDNTAESERTISTSVGTGAPYALGATQSKATIYSGTNDTANVTPVTAPTNPYFNQGIDSPRFAVVNIASESCPDRFIEGASEPVDSLLTRSVAQAFSPLNGQCDELTTNSRMMNSKNPIFLSENDLDLDNAATKGLSHKVFAHFSYQWINKVDYTPYLGFGGSGEFLNNSGDCCLTSGDSCRKECKDDSCKRCGLSQWSIWLKGGISFH